MTTASQTPATRTGEALRRRSAGLVSLGTSAALGLSLALTLAACGANGVKHPAPAEFTTRSHQALTPGCGNGVVEPELGEQCDDGNLLVGDGCGTACQVETGWVCVGVRPSACTASDWSDGPARYGFAQHGRSLPPVSPFVGTDFWTDFPYNLGTPAALALKIAGAPGTTGQVRNAAGAVLKSFTIPAGGVASAQVNVATYHVTQTNAVTSQGVHITASAAVRVIASSESTYTTDTWGVWGTEMLGTRYLIEDAASSAFPWEINLIAVQDGTSVVVKDTAGAVKASASLNAGQVYQYQSNAAIVGYAVTADHPIAVLAGTGCTNDVGAACDMTAEQMAPVSDWSTAYVVAPAFNDATAESNHVVVASQDDTTVIITASDGTQQTYALNAGQSKMFAAGSTAQLGYLITADKPIAAASNVGDPSDNWDPSLVTWPPIDGWVGEATMSTSGVSLTFTSFLTVITRTSATAHITVNGAAVGGWTAISTTGYAFARVPVPPGDNVIHGSDGVTFAAVATGGQTFVSYGYSSPYDIASVGGSTTCYLGAHPPDYDPVGFAGSAAADQDDRAGDDDEDALSGTLSVQLGASTVSLTLPCNENYYGTDVPSTVYGWIDFDRDGTFEENERASAGCVDPSPTADGQATLTWSNPSYAGVGASLIRLRICENGAGCDSPTGMVASGEVEDHPVHIGACGDGTLDSFEQCDDGNTAGGDGCSATCTPEPGFSCSGSPSSCLLTEAPSIGSPSDGALVTTHTPTLAGTCTDGATVRVHDGAALTCTATCSGGSFTCVAASLADGSHGLTADQQIGGAVSVASATVVVKVDTYVPSAPVIASPATGAVTKVNTPPVSGTCEPGSAVSVRSDGSAACAATCSLAGTFSCASAKLSDGTHTLSATLTDVGGRPSPSSNAPTVTVDTVAPGAPSVAAPAAGVDPGTASPAVSGHCETGDTVSIIENLNTVLCTAACADGAFACTSAPLSVGSHTIQARQADLAGNLSPYSAQRTFLISALPVFAPAFTAPAEGAHVRALALALSCASGDSVTVLDGSSPICAGDCADGLFSCTPALADGVHALTATQSKDGSASGPSAARHVTIDTTAPAAPSVTAPANGSSTQNTHPTIAGTAEPGASVQVSEDGTAICSATADASGAWRCTPTQPLAEGAHTLSAVATDAVGNASPAGTDAFAIDTQAPAAPVLSAPAANTAIDQAKPTFGGTAEPGATVTVSEGGQILCTATADTRGAWSCTAQAALVDGAHAITATATDPAGNASAASSTSSFSVDTQAPAAPSLSSPAAGSALDDGRPTFSGTAEPGAAVAVRDGDTVLCTATADDGGAWACAPAIALNDGSHAVTATATDPAGNTSAASSSLAFSVDTQPPAAPAIASPASGSVSGQGAVTLSGTAEPGATVSVYDGDALLCTATADTRGAWSCGPVDLGDGAHRFTATARDGAGNVSSASAGDSLNIDTQAPAAPAVTAPARAADVGENPPTLAGTAEPGATVTVREGAVILCTATADGSGAWTCTASSALPDGSHAVDAVATDAAGNASPSSPADTFVIDTRAPTAPSLTAPASGSAVGSATPSFSGIAEPASTVSIQVDGAQVCTTTADTQGAFACAADDALADGAHTATATATDAAGNTSAPAAPEDAFTVDTLAPSAPGVTAPASGVPSREEPPAFQGTAEPGSTVAVRAGDMVLCVTAADDSGTWRCTATSSLVDGDHAIATTATDAAGNTSAAAATTLSVDTQAPAAPSLQAPLAGASVADPSPSFAGTAEARSTVSVSADGAPLCTATADATGRWGCDAQRALADGPHAIAATATDAAGNTSASATQALIVDTTVPATPAVLAPADGSFVDAAPSAVSGTSEPGMTLTVTLDGAPLCDPVADAQGAWTCAMGSLAEGPHRIGVVATNRAGTSSAPGSTGFVLDLTAPDAPRLTAPADGSHLASATPIFAGRAEPGATVTVSADGAAVCVTTASGAGDFDCPSAALADGIHAATAVATDAAGNVSAASSPCLFAVDTLSPDAPALTAPAQEPPSANAQPTLTGTAEPGAAIAVTEGSEAVCAAVADAQGAWRCVPQRPMTDGDHALSITATDAAGNTSAAAAATVDIDTLAPDAPVVQAPSAGASVNRRTPTFSGTAEPRAQVTVTADGAAGCTTAADSTGAWSCRATAALADGPHAIAATATDAAGNTSEPATQTLIVDTSIPSTPTVTSPADGAAIPDAPQAIAGRAEPGMGVSASLDGAAACRTAADAQGNWSCALSGVTEGRHAVTVIATNAAGTASAPGHTHFTLDTIAPDAPRLAAPADGATLATHTPAISGTAEPRGRVAVLCQGAVLCTATADRAGNFTCASAPLPDHTYRIAATTTDAAGNVSPLSPSVAVTLDTTAPDAPVFTAPVGGIPLAQPSPTFAGTAEAGSTVSVITGDQKLCAAVSDARGGWRCTSGASLADGTHAVRATSTDAVGNVSRPAALPLVIDTVAPDAPTVASPAEGATLRSRAPVLSGWAEPRSRVDVSLDDSPACALSADLMGQWSCTPASALADGPHALSVTATDAASNVSRPALRRFVLDTRVPSTPTVRAPASGAALSAAPTAVSGGADGSARVAVSLDGRALCASAADLAGNWACPLPALADGRHTLTVIATNAAGTSSAPGTTAFSLDTTAPDAAVVTAPADGSTTDLARVPFAGIGEPGAQLSVRVDGAAACTATVDDAGRWQCTAGDALSIGDHAASITQTDAAGHTSAATQVRFSVAAAHPNPEGAGNITGGTLQGGGCESGGPGDVGTALLAVLALGLLSRRRRRTATAAAVMALVAVSVAGTASAQTKSSSTGLRADLYAPAARGSDWFGLDTLDLRGDLRAAAGATLDVGHRPLVIVGADGRRSTAVVADQVILHVGGALVLGSRVRVDAELPVALAESGHAGAADGTAYPGASGHAVGDLRLASDVRLFGTAGGPLTLAAGVALALPVGDRAHYLSDGTTRISLHLLAASRLGRLELAARLGGTLQADDPQSATAPPGDALELGLAGGVRLVGDRLLIGPELWMATAAGAGQALLNGPTTPAEVLLGAHLRVGPFTLGAGIGRGLTHAIGTPEVRALGSIDWSPAP